MAASASAVVREARRAVVVGGGFVGVSCALHLQRTGFHVTLMEAGPNVGGRHAASNGNAGTFAAYANVPVQRPGLWKEAPGMILNPRGALRLALNPHLLKMIPWGMGALASCAPSEVRHTALALGALLRRAEDGYKGAWEQAGVDVDGPMGAYAPTAASADDAFAARHGYILLQKNVDAPGSVAAAALRREGLGEDLRMEALDASGILQLEPRLAPEACAGGAWFFPDGWFLRDPAALLAAMVDGFQKNGGEIRCGDGGGGGSGGGGGGAHVGGAGGSGRVTSLTSLTSGSGGRGARGASAAAPRVRVTAADGTRVDAAVAVVAAGVHSAPLARACGDPVPLDTERGYHVQWTPPPPPCSASSSSSSSPPPPLPPPLLTRPVCTPEGGFIITPMSGGVRAAGLVELGGTAAPPNASRFRQLEGHTKDLLAAEAAAALGPRDVDCDWLGFRPTLPDALPVIGPSSGVPGVVYAFGHQHVGWTLGGVTGKLVADLALGEVPAVDLKPFSARRFAEKAWWRPFTWLR